MERSTDHEFYQQVARPIGAMAKSYPGGYTGYLHQHSRAQFLYAESGTMKVTTDEGTWIVPPLRAVWFPPSYPHQTGAITALEMRTLYICSDSCPNSAPKEPRVLYVSPLLKELVRRAVTMPVEYDEQGHDGRIIALLLEEIDWSPAHTKFIPVLHDPRLQAIEQDMASDPGNTRTLEEWAKLVGASPRTLARLFQRETGMSFRCWRDQFRAMTATAWLIEGISITTLAAEFGYEAPGAFTAMFKRVMGMTPTQFIEDQDLRS